MSLKNTKEKGKMSHTLKVRKMIFLMRVVLNLTFAFLALSLPISLFTRGSQIVKMKFPLKKSEGGGSNREQKNYKNFFYL